MSNKGNHYAVILRKEAKGRRIWNCWIKLQFLHLIWLSKLDRHNAGGQCIGWRDPDDRDRERKNSDRATGCDAKKWRTQNVRSRSNGDRTPKTLIFEKNVAMKLCVWLVVIADRCDRRLRFKEVQDCWRALRHSQNSMEKDRSRILDLLCSDCLPLFQKHVWQQAAQNRARIAWIGQNTKKWHQKSISDVFGPEKKATRIAEIAKPTRVLHYQTGARMTAPFPRLNDPTLPPKMVRYWLSTVPKRFFGWNNCLRLFRNCWHYTDLLPTFLLKISFFPSFIAKMAQKKCTQTGCTFFLENSCLECFFFSIFPWF